MIRSLILSLVMAMTFALADSPSASAAVAIQRVVSPGGIQAWLVEERSVPIIAMDFAFRGGAAQDPAEAPGVANLLSGLLDEGAGELSAQAFQTRLEESAVEIAFDAGRDSFDGHIRTLEEKRDEAFELLRLAVTSARLEQDAIDRIRAQILARLRRDASDPETIAAETWSDAAFPGHPYGRRISGTEKSVAAITRDQLVSYRDRNFARDNLVIAVVGAIDAKTLGEALDKIFGALPEKAKLADVPETEPQGTGKTVVVKEDLPQTTIVFSRPGLKRLDPDYIPAVVMNHILGGGTFTSRLFNEVREKRGLAYSVSSYMDPLDRAGVFGGGIATRNDRAAQALSLIEDEIKRFAKDGPTEDELKKAKLYLTGSYALNFDSSTKIARVLKQLQLQGLDAEYIIRRNDLVNAVSVADIRRAAGRVLGDGKLLTVAVGQPTGLEPTKADK